VLSLQKDLGKEIDKLSEDEIDMLVMLMNRDLRKDAADKKVWQIAQADTTGLIFGNVERVKLLFERVKTDDITAASKPALQRLGSFTESHKKVLSSLKLTDSLRNLLNKNEGK